MMSLTSLVRRGDLPARTYQLTDLLLAGRTMRVSADGLVGTVAARLAEFCAHSPLVEDLARTVRNGDWPTAHAIADSLSVDVAVAA